MKKIYLLGVMLFASLFIACNFTEEIFFEEDGSGKISINFDGSELMEMAGDEFSKSNEKAVDSIISFKEFLEKKKDSIAMLSVEEQAKLKKLEPFKIHMVMNPETKEMMFDMYSDFKDISEVSDMFNTFQNASALNPTGNEGGEQSPFGGSSENTEVSYSYKNNVFSRKSRIIDEELHQQNIDSLAGSEMFLSGSSYTLKYHFPRKVKSASIEEATFSADGKTLIYELGFLEYMKNPGALDIEVELEK